MYIGFSTKLRKASKFRLHSGIDMRRKGAKTKLFFFICFAGFFYLMYWTLLASLWFFYGICYLCFYLPIKAIVKAVKKSKANSVSEEA